MPTGQVTFDATNGTLITDRTVAQVLSDIAVAMGVPVGNISASDVAALDVLNSAEVGIYITDTASALSAMDDIASSIGAWYGYDASGTLRMGLFDASTSTSAGPSVASFDVSNIIDIVRVTPKDETNGLPVWRVRLGYKKMYTVQTSDIAGSVSAAQRAIIGLEYRFSDDEDVTIKTQYETSPVLERNTLLVTQADADAEATRLTTLFKARRDTFEVSVRAEPDVLRAIDLSKVVTVTHPRYGLSAGKTLLILGMQTDFQNNSAKLSLWG